ncbi:hypothetical protein BGX33_005121 [Mortierella sp. NVP41]|nr:hypothetical protein BGX33_005121 [Mortierella sp. NVP41]
MYQPVKMRYYVRVYPAKRVMVQKYRKNYPRDKDWADEVLAKFDEENIPPEGTLNLLYMGKTIASIWSCFMYDLRASNTPSRNRNFSIMAGLNDWTIHEWIDLGTTFEDATVLRTKRKYDDIEINLIALCGPWALNSSPGGARSYWEIPTEFKIALNDCLASSSITPLPPPFDADKKTAMNINEQIRFHFSAMHDFHKQDEEPDLTVDYDLVDDEGVVAIIDAAEARRCLRGHSLSVLLTRDITREGILNQATFESSEVGRSATLHKHMFELAKGVLAGPVSEQLNTPQMDELLLLEIPRVDVWPMSTKTTLGTGAAMFVSRYLCLARPFIVMTHSVPVLSLFKRDVFRLSFLDDDAAQDFMDPNNTQHISRLWRKGLDGSKFKDSTLKGVVPHLAIPMVGRYGPGSDDYAIIIPEYDPGRVFRAPIIRQTYYRIMLLARIVYFVAMSTLSAQLEGREIGNVDTFLLATVKEVMKTIDSSGGLSLLKEAQRELAVINKERMESEM